ncbi:MAG: inorganic phosphate transporter [bacterium]
MHDLTSLLPVLALILAAEFVNGWTDAPNAIATVVSTRVLTPYRALLMATVFNFLGTLSGVAVASTIGKGIIEAESVTLVTVGAAMVGIVIWSSVAAYYGIPTSESHALVAGLAGAALATAGPEVLLSAGWKKVGIGLICSTFFGFFGGYLIMVSIFWLFRRAIPSKVSALFRTLQVFSASFMAFSHGSNDGQKFMGVFTLSLVLGGVLETFAIPLWVKVICAAVMAVGTATGGWRIVRTMGISMTKLEPVHGFAAETAAATVIETASRLGIPLSTTHTINTAIMGVGATRRLSAVRWGVTFEIIAAWFLTFPVCGAIAWLCAKLFHLIF